MPTWNSMRYIRESIASLQAQTHSNYELLICDGGSQDGTVEYLESIMDPRLRIVSRHDEGLVNALNIGFTHAVGELFCWLNSDDRYLSNDALERVARRLSDPNIQYAIGGCAMLTEKGKAVRYLLPWIPQPPFRYRGHSNCFTGSLFFTKSEWIRFGRFSELNKFAFEYELVKQLMNRPEKGCVLNGPPIAGFRLRPDSVSSANSHAMALEKNKVIGCVVSDNAPIKHQLIRLYSYLRLGLLTTFFRYINANRKLAALGHAWKS